MTRPAHLDPSELGTRAYWDEAYAVERDNFAANQEDEGTIWFSDVGAEERMCAFLEGLDAEGLLVKGEDPGEAQPDEDAGAQDKRKFTSFLDLGTGNGHLLFALREDDWLGDMVGIDYSATSITLANEILASKTSLPSSSSTSFQTHDILSPLPTPASPHSISLPTWCPVSGFDVVLDKGTFDAISLSQDTDAHGRRACETYAQSVVPFIKPGGRFLITSCNWTAEEVRGWFEGAGATSDAAAKAAGLGRKGELAYERAVKYPSFTFGGQTGSSVVTMCFIKQ